jgi:hypothetical protein
MGGTTAKVSVVEDGEVRRAAEYSVGAGMVIGSRLLTGVGYALKVPAIDLAEVGAGGGSLIAIDAGGALTVGPENAGPSPGPACYDQGGTIPTVTGANLVLGYINPRHLVGGAVRLDAEKARRVFAERIARPLGMSMDRAAYGAHQIAASNMIRAIKALSTERGRHPCEFALFAFGGMVRFSPAAWRQHLACGASSCPRRRDSSPPSACSTPMSNTIARAPSGGCCAALTSPRSSGPGKRWPRKPASSLQSKDSSGLARA